MATNMYRVGDYVYFETSNSSPYLIRRIEELNKTSSGNVEAKVMCFYRRKDLPNPLVQLADKHQLAAAEDSPIAIKLKKTWLRTPVGEEQAAQAVLDPSIASLDEEKSNSGGGGIGNADLSSKQRHQIKHRELFLSRQVETLPATSIRGKCSVTLLNETESLTSYLNKEDSFFYCLVFDPNQKTLLADKGEIRVGSRYQTEITPLLKPGEKDDRTLEQVETLVWNPNHNLTDRKIDQFLVVSRSIGTFARALDCSSSVKQPSLHMSAAAASRDITLFHAMDTLHKHNYSIEDAMCSLVPSTGPVLCRDEIEDWSAAEANLFEEALDKFGKDFNDIRHDFLPWKTLKQIIEYYYMWKTTDRYVQQKRVKAVAAESKLKQVYIPNYNTKPNSGAISNKGGHNYNGSAEILIDDYSGKPCESCSTNSSNQWYPWGPQHMNFRLCQNCWNYWKKYAGLHAPTRVSDSETESQKKRPVVDLEEDKLNDLSNKQHKCSINSCGKEFKLKTHLARHYAQAHGIALRSGSPRPIMKTRTAFYLKTTPYTRLSRILCRHIIKAKKAARQPSYMINIQAVKQEFSLRLASKPYLNIRDTVFKKKYRGSVTKIANRLGSPGGQNEWLILTPKENMPQPDKVAFPRPPKASDGSLMYERVPNKIEKLKIDPDIITLIPTGANTTIKKRSFEDVINTPEINVLAVPPSVVVGPPTKRANKDPMPSHRPTAEQFAAIVAASGQNIPRHHLNGKPKIAQVTRTGSGRKQVISWMDAPDDVYFRANKKARKSLSTIELRRAARRPWRNLPIPNIPIIPSASSDLQVVVLD
ncbi:metastasis-associated protein MTA3 [Condylostylus longicornis]|uniref:metastasis-associated protein MTA3 n=1 Tax=Condylostylus longicornis TaxID=2530218 RepID=UPI00244E38DD|nr:metastasis-associated protein MTA3 [Condylostylus longicornis]